MTDTNDTPIHKPQRGSARAALGVRDFRLVWFGSLGSNIGTWMQNVVLPAYVYHRTGKASVVGLLIFAQLGPLLFLSIPAGVIADRFNRKKWLVSMQVVQLSFSLALATLALGTPPIWALLRRLSVWVSEMHLMHQRGLQCCLRWLILNICRERSRSTAPSLMVHA